MYQPSLPLDQWELSLTIQIKLTLMMDFGSFFKIGLNVLSNVVEALKHYKNNVFHLRARLENHVMETKFWSDHAIKKNALRKELKIVENTTKSKMSLCKPDNFLEDSKEQKDVSWLKVTLI
jgi:flagellar motor switch protein FliM